MQQKYLTFLGAALLASTGLMLSAGSAAAVDGWIMKCQGGGNMQAVTTWTTNGNGNKTTTDVFFTRARVGSQTQAPPPGTCTWERRAIRPDEPRKLTFSAYYPLEVRCARNQCDVISGPSVMLQLQTYVQAGAPFAVLVHNDNAGGFKIMQVLD